MPALDFRAFAAGFATQAQKIEEESAKIGMELLKKAMDDFREEAKDYKPKYEDEIRNKKEQATYLRDTIGLDDTQVKVLLDRGDLAVKDFVGKAEKAKKFQQLDDYKGLVRLAEAQEPITGFDIIDYIDSGAYVKTKAPVYVGPEGFKTGVFGREVSLGDKNTVESTKSAYIPEKGGYEGDVPSTMGAKVDLTSEFKRGAYQPFPSTSAQPRSIRKEIEDTLVEATGMRVAQGPAGEYLWGEGQADVKSRIARDTEKAYRAWENLHKPDTGADVALGTFPVYGSAIDLAIKELDKEVESGTVTADKAFYNKAPTMQITPDIEVQNVTSAPVAQPANSQKASLATPETDPIISIMIKSSNLSLLARRNNVAAVLMEKFGFTDPAKAKAEAAVLVPK
ncbi:hypothetical protein OAF54_01880 [bacterium]|nr:hypothetical protein [bacterium]